jgi:hypothetical protein
MRIEQQWLQTTKVMVDKVILMVRDHHMRGGYGGDLDLLGIERLLKNLFQKLNEYTVQLVKLQDDKEEVDKAIKEYKTKLEVYDKVFEEFSPSNQKLITKIKERVEEECKLQQ